MTLPILALIVGLAILVWSADRFVDGSAAVAKLMGMPSLLIGMIVIGFGTSAPEMSVSAFASVGGNPAIALGNAYGSNITNIALILGITALISPILVHSTVLKKELPILVAVSGLAWWQLLDGRVSRWDAVILLGVLFAYVGWSIYEAMRNKEDSFSTDMDSSMEATKMTMGKGIFWVVVGLVLLIASSRLLVWGAVEIATALGVSELIIGLTVVAVGTSLPELASSILAIRKNEHDLALGNIIGSNLFNATAVVGLAGVLKPIPVDPDILSRDIPIMMVVTLALFVVGVGIGGPGRINRWEGALLLATFIGYTAWLAKVAIAA